MEKPNEDTAKKSKDRMIASALGENIAITPSDIYNQDFKRILFGYDPKAVDAFLERAADMLERLLGQVRQLREKVDEQRNTLDEYREIEKTLRSALVSSQKFSEDILASAKREAESLIEEARLAKAQAQIAAAKLPRKLVRDIHVLEQQRTRLRREIIAILDTHRSLLDSLVPEEDVSPVGFFDAGADDGGAQADEDTDLPVVNIADENGDSDEHASTGVSTAFETSADPADETAARSSQEAHEDLDAQEAAAPTPGGDEADKAASEPEPPAQDPSEEQEAAGAETPPDNAPEDEARKISPEPEPPAQASSEEQEAEDTEPPKEDAAP